jgi:hypothetical protein
MKASVKLLAFVSVLALGASALAGDKKTSADDLRAWYAKAVAEFVACDTSSYGKYSAEGHSGYYPDSKDLVDEASEEARLENVSFCEGGGKHEMTYDIADVVMLKDAALVLGSGHYKRTEPEGAVSIDADYNFTEVLVKTGDGWKFRHSHVGAVLDMTAGEGE